MAGYGRDYGDGRQGGGRMREPMRYGNDFMGGYAPARGGNPYERQTGSMDFAPVPRAEGGPEFSRHEAGGRVPAAWRVHAADVMTEAPEVVTPQSTLAEAARKMAELNVGVLPVVDCLEDLCLQGVVTDRDITIRGLAQGKTADSPVADCMTTDVWTVHPDATMRDVFDVMKIHQVRRVPVTDYDGRLVGIIAQADLAVSYAGLDPERELAVEEVIERISEPGPGATTFRRRF